MINNRYPFVNTPLPYAYNALEPYIDEKTMELHHNRHLQTYIDNLNSVLAETPRLQRLSLEQLILAAPSLPTETGVKVGNNAGGVYNHRLYFDGLINPHEKAPGGWLYGAVMQAYGGIEGFKEEFTKAALSVFGSGYAWLAAERFGKLKIITTANQDTPLTLGLCPVLCIDVWEHAYYLKHYNKRVDYIGDWFDIINWEQAGKNYLGCVNAKR